MAKTVTLAPTTPRLFAETSYEIKADGELVGYVSKVRHTYDANKFKGGRRGNARMVTATVWRYEKATGADRHNRLTFDSRTRALADFLERELDLTWSEARALVTTVKVTKGA